MSRARACHLPQYKKALGGPGCTPVVSTVKLHQVSVLIFARVTLKWKYFSFHSRNVTVNLGLFNIFFSMRAVHCLLSPQIFAMENFLI